MIIIWTGEDRMIPKIGAATKGEPLTVPDYIGNSFIDQGLAKAKKKTKTKTEEDS